MHTEAAGSAALTGGSRPVTMRKFIRPVARLIMPGSATTHIRKHQVGRLRSKDAFAPIMSTRL